MSFAQNYRRVDIETPVENAVTVGIEIEDGQTRAAVWWDAKTGVESGEQQHLSVPEAFAAAEAARELHGFEEIVVILQSEDLWDAKWGQLSGASREPIGDIRGTDLNEDEAFALAQGLEAERDA
jgi:hypothetical protein